MISNLSSKQSLNLIPFLIIALSFGPLVMPSVGLRTEHLIIYGLLGPAILVLLMRRQVLKLKGPLLGVLLLFVGVTIWTLAVTLLSDDVFGANGNILAHLENYLQPIAIILVVFAFLKLKTFENLTELFCRICRMAIGLLCANTLLALASVFFDLNAILSYFNAVDINGSNVAIRSMSMGRFLGIFNQPIESGIVYSIGLLCWGYLLRKKRIKSTLFYVEFACIIIGGGLSISKVFLLGGIPLFLLYLNLFKEIRNFSNLRFVLIGAACVLGIVTIFHLWQGSDFFLRLFLVDTSNTNFIELYSAGRFGGAGTVDGPFMQVWNNSFWCGVGFNRPALLDNAYFEFFLQGGIFGLLMYSSVLCIFAFVGWHYYKLDYEEGRLLLALSILIIGAGLGAPVLTINRVSTVLWVLLTLLLLILQHSQQCRRGFIPMNKLDQWKIAC